MNPRPCAVLIQATLAAVLGLAPLWAATSERPETAALVEEGKRFYADERYQRAGELFEQVVKLEPNVSQHYVWLGRALGRRAENTSRWKFLSALGLARKTREHFERAVELDETNKDALLSLLEFYREAPGMIGGGIDKAEALAARIEKHYPADGARAWASIYEKQENFERAEEKLREAQKLEPDEVGHQLSLASFLSRRGRYDESDKLYQQALKAAPDSPEAWFSRAKSLVRAKRNPNEARQLLSRYVKADLPPDATPRSEAKELLNEL